MNINRSCPTSRNGAKNDDDADPEFAAAAAAAAPVFVCALHLSSSSSNEEGTGSSSNHPPTLLELRATTKSVYWLDPPPLSAATVDAASDTTAPEQEPLSNPERRQQQQQQENENGGGSCSSIQQWHSVAPSRRLVEDASNSSSSNAVFECLLQQRHSRQPPRFPDNFDHPDQEQHPPTTSIAMAADIDSSPGGFFFAGFQLMSNAQQVKVFLIAPATPKTNRTESRNSSGWLLLTTVRGVRLSASNNAPIAAVVSAKQPPHSRCQFFRAQCVVPGGPRWVQSVRLEFHNIAVDATEDASSVLLLDAASSSAAVVPPPQLLRLHQIRWTLRAAPTLKSSEGGLGAVSNEDRSSDPPRWNIDHDSDFSPVATPTPIPSVLLHNGSLSVAQPLSSPAAAATWHEAQRLERPGPNAVPPNSGGGGTAHEQHDALLHRLSVSHDTLHHQMRTMGQQLAQLTARVEQLTDVVQEQRREIATYQQQSVELLLQNLPQQHQPNPHSEKREFTTVSGDTNPL